MFSDLEGEVAASSRESLDLGWWWFGRLPPPILMVAFFFSFNRGYGGALLRVFVNAYVYVC